MSYMDMGDSRLNFARSRLTLEYWVGVTVDAFCFVNASRQEIYLSITSGRYLVTGREYADHTGQTTSR